jgi:hypothetical protein
MRYPLKRETIELISAAQRTPELSLQRQLTSALETAENKRLMALQADNGDMWARAWDSIKEIEEQMTLLDACAFGWIVPLLSDEELNEVKK